MHRRGEGMIDGATAALTHLKGHLPGFNVSTSITHAHGNSTFEKAVVV